MDDTDATIWKLDCIFQGNLSKKLRSPDNKQSISGDNKIKQIGVNYFYDDSYINFVYFIYR